MPMPPYSRIIPIAAATSALAAVCAISACATGSARDSAAVFGNPAAYVGRNVTVCGFATSKSENRNIHPDRHAVFGRPSVGLALDLLPETDDPINGTYLCIRGEIRFINCAYLICSWTNYDYELVGRRVDD